MKLITLIENETCRDDLVCEHGLSLYMEFGGKRILFDAGQSGAFWDNAQKLGVDLAQVDIAVLSHGHGDHGGGMDLFLEKNTKAPLYLMPGATEEFYNAAREEIGLSQALKTSKRLRFIKEETELAPGIRLIPGHLLPQRQPIDSAGLTVRRQGELVPDDFLHEQYLLLEGEGKRILISGCSHRGILNIADYFRPDVLIGGFHFFKEAADSPMVLDAANKLLEYPGCYYTGHCTGLAQFDTMKKIMVDRLSYLSTGTVLEL